MHQIVHRTRLSCETCKLPKFLNKMSVKSGQFRRSFETLAALGLKLVLALTLLLSAAEDTNAEKNKKRRRSLLNYQIDSQLYQDSLRAAADQTGSCIKSADRTVCNKALSTIKAQRKTLSRGYHDELFFLEGLLYEQLSNNQKALDAYNSSLKLGMNNVDTLFRKAIVLEALKNYEQAIGVMREFLWLSKDNQHEAQFVIGRCLCASNRCQKGMGEVEAALTKYPRFTAAIKFLLEKKKLRLTMIKDPIKKAELEAQIATDLYRLVKLEPENREASLELARYTLLHSDPLVHAQRLQEAELIARKYVDGSGYKDIEAVRLLFDLYIRRGKTLDAGAILNKGLEVTPHAPTLLAARRQLEIQEKVDKLKSKESDGKK